LRRKGRFWVGREIASSEDHDSGSQESCCDQPVFRPGHPAEGIFQQKVKANFDVNLHADIETSSAREHVLLRVQGMTCTGCENKLTRALHTLPGLSNIRVVFVHGRADFDLDTTVIKAKDAILRAQEITGFELSRVQCEWQQIDVLMHKAEASQLARDLLPGVIDVEILESDTARLTYDPEITGARDLMNRLGASVHGLSPPGHHGTLSAEKKHLRELLAETLMSACFTVPVAVLAWADIPAHEITKAIVSLVLATCVQAIAFKEFYLGAIHSLVKSRVIELDMLVVLSTTAAFVYSVVAFVFLVIGRPLEIREFFETSTLLITLVLLGRLVAVYARTTAVRAVSLRSLQAATAILVKQDGTREEIDTQLLQFGDSFIVSPHSLIPTDGVVIGGVSEVDESMLTGESTAVVKSQGTQLIAGTINGDGTLEARLTRLPGKNTVADIAELVEDAYSTKSHVQDLADRLAGYFIPVMLIVTAAVFFIWLAVMLAVRHESGGAAVSKAISYAIAVLAISCPCALGLAVPMVLVAAGGIAARAGVVVKSANAIEQIRKVTDVVFDKTGTLTMAELETCMEQAMVTDRQYAISVAYTLAEANQHPVSKSVARHLTTEKLLPLQVHDVRVIAGAGVEARLVDGRHIRAGNPYWLGVQDRPEVRQLLNDGQTAFCVSDESSLLAVFGLRSAFRPEIPEVMEKLRQRQLNLHLVSGDCPSAVESAARALAIPLDNVRARQSPADKRQYVRDLADGLAGGQRKILFCGDGTNDAAAMAQADVGVQMGTASDVTSSTADVTLLGPLNGLTYLFDLSIAAHRRIAFNLVWSALYNVGAVLLAAGAFVKVRIAPAYAGLGELVSVLPVVLAGLTMLSLRRDWGAREA